jgi:hypothetical protein
LLLAIGALTGGGLAGGVDGLGCGVGTLAVAGGSGAAAACEVRWTRARDDDPRVPQERAIEGPAVKPTIAPATAPTGPSTTAPDTAPIAASAARSCALAPNDTSKPAASTATRILRMTSSLPNNPPKGLRKCGGTKVFCVFFHAHEKAGGRAACHGLPYASPSFLLRHCPFGILISKALDKRGLG